MAVTLYSSRNPSFLSCPCPLSLLSFTLLLLSVALSGAQAGLPVHVAQHDGVVTVTAGAALVNITLKDPLRIVVAEAAAPDVVRFATADGSALSSSVWDG